MKIKEKLFNTFPRFPIPDMYASIRARDAGNSKCLSMIRGKTWDEIARDTQYLKKHIDFFCELEKSTYAYYLPAVILYTYEYAENEQRCHGCRSLPEVCCFTREWITCESFGFDVHSLPPQQRTVVNEWLKYTKKVDDEEREYILTHNEMVAERWRELLEVFPKYPIPDIEESITSMYGDEPWDDSLPLQGRTWDEVANDNQYLDYHYGFSSWLKMSTCLYYLPAVIAYTYRYSENDLRLHGCRSLPRVCDSMMLSLSNSELNIDMLPVRQAAAVKLWLKYVKQVEEENFGPQESSIP